jgi:hypothetical protein
MPTIRDANNQECQQTRMTTIRDANNSRDANNQGMTTKEVFRPN